MKSTSYTSGSQPVVQWSATAICPQGLTFI